MGRVTVAKKQASGAVRAVDGRTPGRRGRETREKLLRFTAELLEKTGYRDLTVIDIARAAGTSPATFYQYFPDVEAAILVLAEAMTADGAHLPQMITSGTWRGRDAYKTVEAFTDAFLDLWEKHRAVMRVVELATAEGDLRFQNIRTHFLNEVTVALRDVVKAAKADGSHPDDVEPMAHAATVVSMLAHVASHRYGYEFWGIRTADVRTSLVRIVYWSVTGKKPPA